MLLGGSCSLAAGFGGGLCGEGMTDQEGGDVTAVGHGGGGDIAECAGGDLYGCGCHNLAIVLLFAVSNYAFLLLLSSYNFAFL
jgi:hypothetical protein